MDPDIAELVREQRLLEAARLASKRGDAQSASAIFEQACEWACAAAEALRTGEAVRALELALCGGDEAIAAQAIAVVIRDGALAENAAAQLAGRGQHAWAARVLEGCGRAIDAARSWERAGDALRAAALLEKFGQAPDAARALQAALLRDPNAWGVMVALGSLLNRFGKCEAAVRLLQRIPANAAERREALHAMVHAFEQLGLVGAAHDAMAELQVLDGSGAETTESRAKEKPPSPAGPVFGRYEIVRQIASSPSARVLECLDVVRGERVALKWFVGSGARSTARDALSRFEREVRAMGSLADANVVPLRAFIAEGPALALGWMAGGTLEQMLSSGPIAPERAVEIAVAVLSALGAAHRIGILHRDVKPANVLFDAGGGTRLGDFGVAHLGDLSSTLSAGDFATTAYLSPEQRGGGPATAASDIYAVGMILREMMTSEKPTPDAPPRVLPSGAHRGLDARHDAVVAHMTALDPRDRPPDAFEARSALLALTWPRTFDASAPGRAPWHKPAPPVPAGRMERRPNGAFVDLWTEREIEHVLLTDHALARARGFAQADHSALQTVLRADVTAGAIWLEKLDESWLDRELTPEEAKRICEALAALHATGATHGRVDREHVTIDAAGRVALRFHAAHEPSATPDQDRRAVSKL